MEDFFGTTLRGDRNEQLLAAIEINQRGRAQGVGIHPHANGFRTIILALKKFPAAVIAHTRILHGKGVKASLNLPVVDV